MMVMTCLYFLPPLCDYSCIRGKKKRKKKCMLMLKMRGKREKKKTYFKKILA